MPGTRRRPSDCSIRRLTKTFVNKANAVVTRVTPTRMNTMAKAWSQGPWAAKE